MVLQGGRQHPKLGFSPGREEPVSGAQEPEESWQDRAGRGVQDRAKQPGSQRWAPLLPQVEAHRGAALLLQPSSPGAGPGLFSSRRSSPAVPTCLTPRTDHSPTGRHTFTGSTECTLGQVCIPHPTPMVLPPVARRQSKQWSLFSGGWIPSLPFARCAALG